MTANINETKPDLLTAWIEAARADYMRKHGPLPADEEDFFASICKKAHRKLSERASGGEFSLVSEEAEEIVEQAAGVHNNGRGLYPYAALAGFRAVRSRFQEAFSVPAQSQAAASGAADLPEAFSLQASWIKAAREAVQPDGKPCLSAPDEAILLDLYRQAHAGLVERAINLSMSTREKEFPEAWYAAFSPMVRYIYQKEISLGRDYVVAMLEGLNRVSRNTGLSRFNDLQFLRIHAPRAVIGPQPPRQVFAPPFSAPVNPPPAEKKIPEIFTSAWMRTAWVEYEMLTQTQADTPAISGRLTEVYEELRAAALESASFKLTSDAAHQIVAGQCQGPGDRIGTALLRAFESVRERFADNFLIGELARPPAPAPP